MTEADYVSRDHLDWLTAGGASLPEIISMAYLARSMAGLPCVSILTTGDARTAFAAAWSRRELTWQREVAE